MKPINVIMIIFGISLIGSYIIYDNTSKKINEVVANNYLGKQTVYKEDTKDNIIGVLRIPKINFKMGFYNYQSSNNNVDKNITLLNNNLPDSKNGLMVIAAHSGNSYLGFFKNLDKLVINDIVEIYYHNKIYYYIVDDIYEEDKDGSINYQKNNQDNVLILTTCSKKKDKQLIVVSKLWKEEINE